MAKKKDVVWYRGADGEKWKARVTRAQSVGSDGLPAADSYDADTVDLVLHVEVTDESGATHSTIHGGVVAAKIAKTAADQKTVGRWWPTA